MNQQFVNFPNEKEASIGIWGQRHAEFLKKYKRAVYMDFVFSGKLAGYLAQIDNEAQEMFDLLVRQLAEKEGVTEQLKSDDQMKWVQRMNNIRSRATKVVNHELIFN